MSGLDSIGSSDSRLMAHALGAAPAWLWSIDGTRILWANPPGAEIFRAPSGDALAVLEFELTHSAATQIAWLADNLPASGVWRLERLRGFGDNIGDALTCQCMRIQLADGTNGILVVAGERAGPDMPFEARLRRLLTDSKAPAAAFTESGKLLDTSAEAAARLGEAREIAAVSATQLAQQASAQGHAEGETPLGRMTIDRLATGDSAVLFLTFAAEQPASTETTEQSVATKSEGADAPSTVAAAPIVNLDPTRPLRFIWEIDSDQRFTVRSDEFMSLAGPETTALLGKRWPEIAPKLDPNGMISTAIASNETWSGLLMDWPIDGETITVEMSGLPVFGPGREIAGYRGFGLCRDTRRLGELAGRRSEQHAAPAPAQEPVPAAGAQNPEVQPSKPSAEQTEQQQAPETSATVVPFPSPDRAGTLTPKEAVAFNELARELSDRLKHQKPVVDDDFGDERHEPISTAGVEPPASALAEAPSPPPPLLSSEAELPILDRLPVGILIYRLNDLIYANRAFLEWTGYPTLQALRDAGGLDTLFIESAPGPALKNGNGGKTLTITTPAGKQMPVQGRLFTTQWSGDNALVLMLNTAAAADRSGGDEVALRRLEGENRELRTVLDTATDGILLVDGAQHILSANHGAQSLFGREEREFAEIAFDDLFAPESKRPVLDYFERLTRGGSAALINEGLEVTAQEKGGGRIPLHMSLGPIEGNEKFCAIFRDITAWKRTEGDLINARRQAESASAAKSDFLAKISHEIRTPLNAIIGFSEVMTEERFGPIGNDRYKQYLHDIRASGGHLISLLNELLDLSKIEAGKLDLTFTGVNLNDLTQQCVAIMQQQANRQRVIIRSSLAPSLPQIVADARSIRQIVLNLLSNAIKFTGAGAQVIVSTALTDAQEVVLRVRDTGEGMSEQELKAALEPFRQLATASRWGSSGTGLGLPITKALAEANHARFNISSARNDGTMVEIAFPATRILA